jgi:hypothetical protein
MICMLMVGSDNVGQSVREWNTLECIDKRKSYLISY